MFISKTIYLVVGLLFAIIIAAVIGGFLTYLPKYYRLNRYGVETQGKVISKEKENHQFIRVEYEVNNRKFETVGNAEDFGKVFFTVKLHEDVPVYYNPDAPEESCLGKPNSQLKESIMGVCFISLTPIFLYIIFIIKTRFK